MAFCLYCGKELTEQDRFCGHCGKEVPETAPVSAETPNLWASVNTPAVPSPAAVTQAPVTPAYAPPSPYAPSYAPVMPAAPMKKPLPKWLLPTLIAVGTAIVVLVVCLLLFGKSDEQKIRERFDTFATAINNRDLQGMFGCFDSKTRGLMDFSIGILSASGQYGEMMESLYEIEGFVQMQVLSVQVNGNKATATVVAITNGDSEPATLPMVKENGEWYIDLMSLITQMVGGNLSYSEPITPYAYDNPDIIPVVPDYPNLQIY